MNESFALLSNGEWINWRFVERVGAESSSGVHVVMVKVGSSWLWLNGGYADLGAAKKAAAQLTQGFDPSGLVP
jgi:hypothetical protein